MKLKLLYVKDNGDLKNERVVLKAVSRVDIGGYLLSDTTFNDKGGVSNKLRHVYWFPDRLIEPGDFVALYTRKGVDSQRSNKAGTITHWFFWDLDGTIWNKDKDAAVLFEIENWLKISC